jgi:hypothetical protein
MASEDIAPFDAPIPEATGAPVVRNPGRRAALMLLVATGLALVICALIFVAVLQADFLTGAAEAVNDFLFHHSVIAISLACSPLFGAMLVGYGYAQRAIARRRREKASGAAAPAAEAP